MKKLFFPAICVLCLVSGALVSPLLQRAIHFPGTLNSDGRGTALDWRSYSANERAIYAKGYANGYNFGVSAACGLTDQLFEIRGKVYLQNGVLSNQVELCDSSVDHFTRVNQMGTARDNYSVYSNEITKFYRQYPKYKNVMFSYLFTFLSDRNHETADQIFQELERNHM